MSRTASSNGPGMGRSPKAASPLSGLGIRPSRARIVTARMRRRAAATKPSQPFGLPPHVFLQEHGAELLNACGRVIERGKNRPSVGDREREYLRLAGLCGLKFVGEVWGRRRGGRARGQLRLVRGCRRASSRPILARTSVPVKRRGLRDHGAMSEALHSAFACFPLAIESDTDADRDQEDQPPAVPAPPDHGHEDRSGHPSPVDPPALIAHLLDSRRAGRR
jgi:hypothetical protein